MFDCNFCDLKCIVGDERCCARVGVSITFDNAQPAVLVLVYRSRHVLVSYQSINIFVQYRFIISRLTEEELLCGRSYYKGDELAIEEDDDRTEIGSLRNEIIKQARELNLAEEESQSKMKEILTLEDRIERQVQELELVTDHWEDDKQRMKTLQAEITYKARELETVQEHAHQLELGAEISKGTIERLGNQVSVLNASSYIPHSYSMT